MIEIFPESSGKCIGMKINGKLMQADYKEFVPKLEAIIKEYGSLRCCVELTEMHGFQYRAIWDELKFDTKHLRHIERCAMIGDPSWHQWWGKVSKMMFPKAKLQCFESDQREEAWSWLTEDQPADTKTGKSCCAESGHDEKGGCCQ